MTTQSADTPKCPYGEDESCEFHRHPAVETPTEPMNRVSEYLSPDDVMHEHEMFMKSGLQRSGERQHAWAAWKRRAEIAHISSTVLDGQLQSAAHDAEMYLHRCITLEQHIKELQGRIVAMNEESADSLAMAGRAVEGLQSALTGMEALADVRFQRANAMEQERDAISKDYGNLVAEYEAQGRTIHAAEEKIAALTEGARIMDTAAENTIAALRAEVEQLRGERDHLLDTARKNEAFLTEFIKKEK